MDPSRTSGGRYHRVTTSEENVWLGMDLDRARPGIRTRSSQAPAPNESDVKWFLTEVGQLEFSEVADEQVLGLQVSVEDPSAVDVAETSQQLEQEHLKPEAVGWSRTWFLLNWTGLLFHILPGEIMRPTRTLCECRPPGCWIRY